MKNQIEDLYKKIQILILFPRSRVFFKRFLKIIGLDSPFKWFLFKFERLLLKISDDQLNFFSQFLKEGDLCFDIGAWEGEYTELFLRLGAKVIAVEPQQDCVYKLNIFFSKNKNVKIFGKAVGEKLSKSQIAICESPGHSQKATMSKRFQTETRHAKECKWTKFQPVLITTLDSLINQYGVPRFCKIDVEGFEEYVIKGLTYPIHFISFEFQKELLDIIESCCDHLSSIGEFKYNCTFAPLNVNFIFPKCVSAEELCSEIKKREDITLGGDIYAKYIGKGKN